MSATSVAASLNPAVFAVPFTATQRGRDEGARVPTPRTPRARPGVVVAVRGEVDAHTAPRLAAALAQTAAGQHQRVVLDLGGCTFLGVAGLRVIAATAAAVAPSGQTLALRAASPSILRILDVTGIGQLVDLEAGSAGDR